MPAARLSTHLLLILLAASLTHTRADTDAFVNLLAQPQPDTASVTALDGANRQTPPPLLGGVSVDISVGRAAARAAANATSEAMQAAPGVRVSVSTPAGSTTASPALAASASMSPAPADVSVRIAGDKDLEELAPVAAQLLHLLSPFGLLYSQVDAFAKGVVEKMGE